MNHLIKIHKHKLENHLNYYSMFFFYRCTKTDFSKTFRNLMAEYKMLKREEIKENKKRQDWTETARKTERDRQFSSSPLLSVQGAG